MTRICPAGGGDITSWAIALIGANMPATSTHTRATRLIYGYLDRRLYVAPLDVVTRFLVVCARFVGLRPGRILRDCRTTFFAAAATL
jgi:hypothetical protein